MTRPTARIPWLGYLKVSINRLQAYASLINFIMVTYLFIVESPWPTWSILTALVVGMAILLFLDLRYIMPSEYSMSTQFNPKWRDLEDTQREILRVLRQLEAKFK